jgi:hypothetical protein
MVERQRELGALGADADTAEFLLISTGTTRIAEVYRRM